MPSNCLTPYSRFRQLELSTGALATLLTTGIIIMPINKWQTPDAKHEKLSNVRMCAIVLLSDNNLILIEEGE
jgi:hypothetical protein